MTDLKKMTDEYIEAIKQCKDKALLYEVLDDLLVAMPKDIVYLEWKTRPEIADMVPNKNVDECMEALWDCDASFMDEDSMYDAIDNYTK